MATLRNTFDPSKFQKSITKSIKNISTGFNDPDTWISTGNYALNKRISGDFYKGIPLGKITIFSGSSGAGKSFLASGSIVKNAQEQGIFCVIIDSENALDEAWLQAVGVDTSSEKLLRISATMIDDVAKIMGDFIKEYKDNYGDLPREERPKVLFVIDSLGMLMSPTEVSQFEAADMKGDMGRKSRQLKSLVINLTNAIGNLNIGMVCTNHTYQNQNIYSTEGSQISVGGSGLTYASSILVIMSKGKLKINEDGVKTKEVHGIRAVCEVAKTRYAKPFEKIEIEIPYEQGMIPTSGLVDYFKTKSVLVKSGNRWKYVDKSGTEHIKYEKDYDKNENGILDLIMSEWSDEIDHRDQIELEDITDDVSDV